MTTLPLAAARDREEALVAAFRLSVAHAASLIALVGLAAVAVRHLAMPAGEHPHSAPLWALLGSAAAVTLALFRRTRTGAPPLPPEAFAVWIAAVLAVGTALVRLGGAPEFVQLAYVLPVIFAFAVLPPQGAAVALVGAAVLSVAVAWPEVDAAWADAVVRVVTLATIGLLGGYLARTQRRDIALRAGHEALLERRGHELDAALGRANDLALHDALTGLPNRVLLNDRIGHALALAPRDREPVTLLVMDLDRFKQVNDVFGHAAGDQLLRAVGPRLRSELRAGDTLARLGGDEFVVVLPGMDPLAGRALAMRLLGALEQPFSIEGHAVTISASVGIASTSDHADDPETLLRRADTAMYAAKRLGLVVTHAADLDDAQGADHIELLADLAAALDRDELTIEYQPQADTVSGQVAVVEALVRWRHPTRGTIPPSEFVPLAEQSGLIRRISDQVLRAAIRQARVWRDAGRDVRVAVNISARDVVDALLPDLVRIALESEGLPADRLILEITESALLTDQERARRTVARLNDLGIAVSVDDYGSGYSSIAYLSRLRIDEVKIDRSFVTEMSDPRARAVVRTTIELGHALGLRVVAEGVEDEATWVQLRELGCDRIQGYLVGRPAPADAVALRPIPPPRGGGERSAPGLAVGSPQVAR